MNRRLLNIPLNIIKPQRYLNCNNKSTSLLLSNNFNFNQIRFKSVKKSNHKDNIKSNKDKGHKDKDKDEPEIKLDINDFKVDKYLLPMDKTVEHLKASVVDTSRAKPELIEKTVVNHGGKTALLNDIAQITIKDSRTLLVDSSEQFQNSIIKSLRVHSLGLNPSIKNQTCLEVHIPILSPEQRKKVVKQTINNAEKSRLIVSHNRSDALNTLKKYPDSNVRDKIESDLQKHVDKSNQSIKKFVDDIKNKFK